MHGFRAVAERGVEDTPLAVRDGHEQRFLLPAATLFPGRHGARKDGHVFRRTTQPVVELVLAVHERGGQAGHDRMSRGARGQHELMLLAVAAARAGRGIQNPFALTPAQIRSALFVASAPAAHADHFVVGFPFRKRIVRRVDTHEASAATDEFLKRLLRRR